MKKNNKNQKKPQKKRGFWGRLIHSRLLWAILIGLFGISILFSWLMATYKPPFPPHWIGVKYYVFDIEEPIDLDKLSSLEENLKTIQTSLLVFEPSSKEAARILPENVVVYTYTLTDFDAIRFMMENELAKNLTGIDPSDKALAQNIINDPLSYLELDKIVLVVTQTNNITPDEALFLEELTSYGKEVPHEIFDEVQDTLEIAPVLEPLESENMPENYQNLITIDEANTYRLYENEQSKTPVDSSVLEKEYDSFVRVNNTLVPVRGGRSPLLVLEEGQYELQEGASFVPISYYHAVHTLNGLPFVDAGVGHGWTSISYEENGTFYPLLTASLFNSLDMDNSLNKEAGNFTNIATYTNLGINQVDDWERSKKTLNRIPLELNESRTRINKISPEDAENILLKRGWYLPRYSTQEYYMKYLQESRDATPSLKDKFALSMAILNVHYQNIVNQTFWGAIQAWMNGTLGDTRYNGITSNCVSYSTDFWNSLDRGPYYDPRMLKLVAVPGKLYKVMKPDEVISLPDANMLPEDQRDQPYMGTHE